MTVYGGTCLSPDWLLHFEVSILGHGSRSVTDEGRVELVLANCQQLYYSGGQR